MGNLTRRLRVAGDPPPHHPSLLERRLFHEGMHLVAGLDEVGRGCLAGPVVAACCVLPPHVVLPGLDDSKLLTPRVRERLFEEIAACARAWSWAAVEAAEIDRLNIHHATLRAMLLSVERLPVTPDILLIDGVHCIASPLPQQAIPGGDGRCQAIAAASILAKVTRDRLMVEWERRHPGFSFSRHKGYGTRLHCEEIARLGPTPIHRRTFQPVARYCGGG